MPESFVALLKPVDAAKRLAVSPRTLEKWRIKGGGPRFVKAGRSVKYREGDLDAWAAKHVRSSTSDDGLNLQPSA